MSLARESLKKKSGRRLIRGGKQMFRDKKSLLFDFNCLGLFDLEPLAPVARQGEGYSGKTCKSAACFMRRFYSNRYYLFNKCINENRATKDEANEKAP